MARRIAVILVMAGVVSALVACSTSNPPTTNDDGGTGSDGGPEADAASPSDGGSDAGADAAGCVDTTNDPNNCGACGYACVNGRSCVNSRCTPAWQPLSTVGAPAARNGHAAVAVYGKYVVLGGTLAAGGAGPAVATAGRYDPATDTWDAFPALVQPRCFHAATSTIESTTGAAGYVLAFGGLTDCSNGTTTGPGLEVSANGGNWQVTSVSGEPTGRYNIAVARGQGGTYGGDLFVYGGSTNTQPAVASGAFLATAAVGTPTWTSADCGLAQCERGGDYAMFLDGDFIRVWGGGPFGNAPAGLQYNVKTNGWSAWTLPANTPALPRRYADDGRRIYFLNPSTATCPHSVEVLIYDRQGSSWRPKDTAAAPSGFLAQAAATWVGRELIAWSGNCGASPSSVGGRYQPPAP